jgi:putative FmdB family regulatory protein
MPIYEYKCQDCGNMTEVFQRGGTAKIVVCSHCGSGELEKVISVPGAILKERKSAKGKTCCGRDERCDTPPCSSGGACRRD